MKNIKSRNFLIINKYLNDLINHLFIYILILLYNFNFNLHEKHHILDFHSLFHLHIFILIFNIKVKYILKIHI